LQDDGLCTGILNEFAAQEREFFQPPKTQYKRAPLLE
jgi:hypothetical protein